MGSAARGAVASRGTASDRLQRILFLLPAAGGDGADLGDLADAFGVSRDVIVDDLDEVAARAYYHRAGPADEVNVYIETDRVRVRTTGDFRRPPKLDPREALALSMGVRVLAGDRDPETRDGLLDLADRLENDLASVRVEDFEPAIAIEGEAAGTSGESGPPVAELRGRLSDAVDDGRVVEFRYLKSQADEPETRALEPYAMLASAGRWYAVGHDRDRDDLRVFRLDRMLELEVLEETFEVPEDFDLDAYLSGGDVYRADEGVTATVRYAPSISRWILERTGAEPGDDGEAVLERHVADPDWVIRHVLQYGGEAELVAPPGLRERVVGVVNRVIESHV